MSLTGDRLRPRKKRQRCGAFSLKVRRGRRAEEGVWKRSSGRTRAMLGGYGLSYSGG
jgi:hypothetical protein